jgi:hypothetical protein
MASRSDARMAGTIWSRGRRSRHCRQSRQVARRASHQYPSGLSCVNIMNIFLPELVKEPEA